MGAGGEATVRGLTQRPYINGPDGFGSGQPDGMLAGMADGSVRFLTKNMAPVVLEQLARINVVSKSGRESPALRPPALTATDELPLVISKPKDPLAGTSGKRSGRIAVRRNRRDWEPRNKTSRNPSTPRPGSASGFPRLTCPTCRCSTPSVSSVR